MTETATVTVRTAAGTRTVAIRYERSGAGEPLLLVHGVGHRRGGWDPLLPVLRERHEVIALDLPGFGDSGPMPDGLSYDLDGYLTVLQAFCEELRIPRPHVAGNSLGGLIALEMGRRELARSVTALSPAGFWKLIDARRAYVMVRLMRLGARALPLPLIKALSRSTAGRFLLINTVYARPGSVAPQFAVDDTLGYARCVGLLPTLRHRAHLHLAGDITGALVTVAWGTKDRLLPFRQAAAARRALPSAHFVELPGCGHTPMPDDPELVCQVILETTARRDGATT